jgi:hypothetical protein
MGCSLWWRSWLRHHKEQAAFPGVKALSKVKIKFLQKPT